MELHVVPLDDVVDHDLDQDCVCGVTMEPVVRHDGSMRWLLIHHALDGREQHEQQSGSDDAPGG